MKCLLDTQLLLWAAAASDKLPPLMAAYLEDLDNTLFFSTASLWEIAIKKSLKRNDFKIHIPMLLSGLKEHGYTEIPITSAHTLIIEELPPLHKDPFDRILIAQATVEGLLLLTTDNLIAQYPGPIQGI